VNSPNMTENPVSDIRAGYCDQEGVAPDQRQNVYVDPAELLPRVSLTAQANSFARSTPGGSEQRGEGSVLRLLNLPSGRHPIRRKVVAPRTSPHVANTGWASTGRLALRMPPGPPPGRILCPKISHPDLVKGYGAIAMLDLIMVERGVSQSSGFAVLACLTKLSRRPS